MGSKGGGSTTTVQKADPWSGQQPYLKEIFQEAQGLYQSGGMAPAYYPGQTVAPESAWTQQARAMQAQRALEGSASVQNAQQAMDATLSYARLRGDKEIYRFDFPPQDGSLGYGASYHPSMQQHEKMASELTAYLKQLMGW